MTIIQICIYFNYLLITYLTVMFERVYVTGITGGSSEFVAYILAGLIYERLGVHRTYLIALGTGIIGGILIIVYGLDHQDSADFRVFFLMCKFSISCSYSMLILANSTLFEVQSAATALSIPMFFARLGQSSSPLISNLAQPIPMYIYVAANLSCVISAMFLRVHPNTMKI